MILSGSQCLTRHFISIRGQPFEFCFITSCPVFAIDFTWQGNVKVNCEKTVSDFKSSYQDTISVDIKAGAASSRVMSSGAPGLQSVVLVLDPKTQIYRARLCQILGNGFLCNETQLDSVAKIVRVFYDWGLEQTNFSEADFGFARQLFLIRPFF